jgi:CTP:molybdopterin cytidylyltransferase MocA/ubiquinone/menaquinone biosynthesis C-methylase UbiE
MRVAAIILAAGAGSRFGGGKLLARIDGAPILAHVVAAARASGLDPIIAVVGSDLADSWAAFGLEPDEIVVNGEPGRGQASSLQLGLAAAATADPPVDAAVILLGDQPLVRAETIRTLVARLGSSTRRIVMPSYARGGGSNPVVLRRSAFDIAAQTSGDRGLGRILDANAGLAERVAIPGTSPDVDTADDLARVAELAWADRVRRNREQVERLREAPDGKDFYASVSSIFRDDPDRTGDAVLDALRRHAQPDDIWLDIGAGAGRYALPLARTVSEVVALDPSASMLDALRESMDEHAIQNVRVIEGRWPADPEAAGSADVALIAHVGYDVEGIGPFIDAMERAARRECVAVLMERNPATQAAPFWPPVHGEERVQLPALPAFVDLLIARGRQPNVEMVESTRRRWSSRDELERFVRRQTWTQPGSAKDAVMLERLEAWTTSFDDGSIELSVGEPLTVGVASWSPR